MRGDVVYIEGLHSATWNDIPSLQKVFSGASFNGRCVLLYGSDGHTAWANQALLARAGVDATFISGLPSTEQQYFGMDQGLPNGRVSEQGISYVVRVVPAAAVSSDDALLYATRHLNSLGITAWMDPATGASSEGMNNQNLETYERVSRAGTLTAHVTTTIVGDGNADAGPQIDVLKAWQQRLGQTPVKVAGFKIFSDGVMEYPTQTASMLAPYKNSGKTGSQMVDPQKYKQFVVAADRQGLLVHIHAIGDRAVTESLNAIAAARKENRNKTIPHSITHLQCVQPSDLARFKELHVLASMLLLWATADTYTEELVNPYIDPVAYAYMYPAHSILLNGGTVCGASDWPVSSANPFEAMYVAETRLGVKGVLNAKEKMSRIDMLRAYTLNAAKAILRDKEIGSLDPGKQADLIVVDRDVMTVSPAEVRGTKVLWTMVNGKLVYQR
jgi:predicted amidohydrolase YtcJ